MIDVLHREFVYLWYYFSIQFERIVFYWIIGMCIGSFISVFAKRKILNIFTIIQSKNWGWLGIFPAALLGIISPLCMYGTIPIAASFSENGAPDDWIAAFMMSSVLLNPQLIAYSAALGPQAFTVRLVVTLCCGVLAGVLVRVIYKERDFFRFTKHLNVHNRDVDPNLFLRYLKNVWRNFKYTSPYFLLGIVLTALFQRYVPKDALVSFFGVNEGFGVLMAATIGIPLYVCGGGTIPILNYWLMEGMSLGSAAAFMTTGPATKITNLGALKSALDGRCFAYYMAYVFVFSFFSGLVVNMVVYLK
jgi:hypothetical protein